MKTAVKKKFWKQLRNLLKTHLEWFSLRWDAVYIRNLVIITGTLFMRRWGRELITQLLWPLKDYAPIVSFGIGMFILFTIDASGYVMGGYEDKEENNKKNNPKNEG